MASHKEELQALRKRYRSAVTTAKKNTTFAELEQLRRYALQTFPVINGSLDFIVGFVSSKHALYSTYQKQLHAQTRKPATFEQDGERLAVESKIFVSFGEDITYAALSCDGRGLWSYGNVGFRIKEQAVAHRSTVLEENSFVFYERNQLGKPKHSMPFGFMSKWDERDKLVIAKLAKDLAPGQSEKAIQSLILQSNGNRALDNFLEIHIFGTFDINAVEELYIHEAPLDEESELLVKILEIKAKNRNLRVSYVE